MRIGYTNLPGKLAELIGKETIRLISQKSNIPQSKWEFDMFLDLEELHSYKYENWIIKHDLDPGAKRIRVNFDYSPYYENERLRELADFYLSYYKLNPMFAELSAKVEWHLLKELHIVHGFNFKSWIMFFEFSFPNDYLFYISSIIKNLKNDQTRSLRTIE